jgi:hypothetical protein
MLEPSGFVTISASFMLFAVILDSVVLLDDEEGHDVCHPLGVVPDRFREIAQPALEVGPHHSGVAANMHGGRYLVYSVE